MRKELFIALLLFLIMTLFIASEVYAKEVKLGDKVTIITPETVARLCPHPSCGQNQHITRIPQGTVLKIEGIASVMIGMLPAVKWFEVTYKGKKGWISIYDTDKQ